MANIDITVTPSVDKKLQSLGYQVSDWSSAKKDYSESIEKVLSTASKSKTGKKGHPDRIYFNNREKLLVLVEEKPTMNEHDLFDITKGAISGIKWYLSRFLDKELGKYHKELMGSFNNYKLIGIAVSGDVNREYQHKFSCFLVNFKQQKIEEVSSITSFVTEQEFLQLFDDTDIDLLIKKISQTTKDINNLLRNIESQQRPVLLSALMICLHKTNKIKNNFNEYYKTLDSKQLINNIISVSKDILKQEGIANEKISILENGLSFLKVDPSLNNDQNNILKLILQKLELDIIPLFNNQLFIQSNYDIIGKFYEEFLKYAGVSNVKKGIVLTPRHITTLFTKLVNLKYNDRIVDLCCGTGSFLIAGMNAIINLINDSKLSNKQELISNVKSNQLLGFEVNSTMYICAISNMLFRGDGKSSIYFCDSINTDYNDVDKILNDFKPTIGFINPPYSGKENKEDPTPKEITFLCKLLDNCSRYGIMIAPLSVYNKNKDIRNNILKKHTLKAVINMPGDLFMPNAGIHTAISVFETNRPHKYDSDEVVFYDLRDDGFIINKNQGRIDYHKKWQNIETKLLDTVNSGVSDNISFVKTNIKSGDEWTIYAFSETDYSSLKVKNFIKTISDYVIFKAKKEQGLLYFKKEKNDESDELNELNELEIIDVLGAYYGKENLFVDTKNIESKSLDLSKWKYFSINDKNDVENSLFEVPSIKGDLKEKDCLCGNIPLISASKYNCGVVKYIDESGDGISEIFKGNAITMDMFCNVFYQEDDFYSVSHGRVNVIIPKFTMNKYIAMFIVTILRAEHYKYPYGRNLYKTETENTKIKLPADKNGKPDFKYMEDFIKSLPYSNLL